MSCIPINMSTYKYEHSSSTSWELWESHHNKEQQSSFLKYGERSTIGEGGVWRSPSCSAFWRKRILSLVVLQSHHSWVCGHTLFLYVTVATVIGNNNDKSRCGGVGTLGIAWSFRGMIFVLLYCTTGVSCGHLIILITDFFLPCIRWYLIWENRIMLVKVGI